MIIINTKKEFIPFLIILYVSFLNLPIILLLNFFKPEFIIYFVIIFIPLECIICGSTVIYGELQNRKNQRNNYKICDGTIKNFQFKLLNFNWIKSPVVSYVVDGKEYELTSNIGINGIVSFFLKGKKIKVYYKEKNPKIALINNNVFIIVGIDFIIIGIFILLFMIFNIKNM